MIRILCIAAVFMLAALPARGFHDGGVASCAGCHVMHGSEDGTYVPVEGNLIVADSASDLCLGCHADASGGVFGYDPLFPAGEYGGGNFIFLLEDNINDLQQGAQQPIGGEAAGHSIVAPGAGLARDSRYVFAPGGSFPSTELGCTSCHDPHGRSGFRMLNGVGPVQGGVAHFSAATPEAEGIALGGAPEGPGNHTAYRSGWSQWCANCHGSSYHASGNGRFDHPSGIPFGAAIAARYNAYLGDTDPTGGDVATAYLPDVPFEDAATGAQSTSGATAASRVTCLSCHRAHASSAPAAGRWDWNVDQLGDDGAVSGSWVIPNPYGDPAQRSLCVKCHDQDHDNGKSCNTCHVPGKSGPSIYDPSGN